MYYLVYVQGSDWYEACTQDRAIAESIATLLSFSSELDHVVWETDECKCSEFNG